MSMHIYFDAGHWRLAVFSIPRFGAVVSLYKLALSDRGYRQRTDNTHGNYGAARDCIDISRDIIVRTYTG